MVVGVPQDPSQLSYAHRLEPFAGRIEREETYEWIRFEGEVFDSADAGSCRFGESVFSSVSLDRTRLRRARFDDTWWHTPRLVGVDAAESTWLDSTVTAGVWAGVEAHGAEFRRIVFHQCKLDSVNFRATDLRSVTFVDCLLRDVDFGQSTLTDVTFPGTTLDRARFDRAVMSRVDLRDAAGLEIASGVEALKGATISTTQLFELAPALARQAGITVKDH